LLGFHFASALFDEQIKRPAEPSQPFACGFIDWLRQGIDEAIKSTGHSQNQGRRLELLVRHFNEQHCKEGQGKQKRPICFCADVQK